MSTTQDRVIDDSSAVFARSGRKSSGARREPRRYATSVWMPTILGVLVLVVIIAAWQLSYSNGWAPKLVVPQPIDVWKALTRGLERGTWWRHIWATTLSTIYAFLVGFAAAIVLGSLFAFSALVRRTFYPYIIAVQSFPKVAVAPLLVVWLGYGTLPKVFIGGLLAFFPIFSNTVAGLTEVDQNEVDLLRSLRAGWLNQLRFLRIPNALSYIFPALNVAAVNALLGVIVGELVGTNAGLGYLISQRAFLGDTAGVFAILILLAVIGITMFVLLRLVERFTKFTR